VTAIPQITRRKFGASRQSRCVRVYGVSNSPTTARIGKVITTAGYTTRIGPLVAERRTDLERLGWTVRLVDKARHDLFTRPEVVVPLVRAFLDPILLRA
jgi:hypothetical protein